MLLTITNTRRPATDLGYLLHKNPTRLQSFELSFGKAHVFYPEASADRCTGALLLDVEPVGLVRTRRGPAGDGAAMKHYVNDRPYVASSFLSVAIARVLGSALSGNSKDRPELVNEPLPLVARITALPCRGGEELLRKLFEPMGYTVRAEHHGLDDKFPEWGDGPYYTVELEQLVPLKDLLTHLYVLIPVLDAEKHYWVGEDEVEKLLHRGEDWLKSHPERELFVKRYLRHQKRLAAEALARLMGEEELDPDAAQEKKAEQEEAVEKPLRLNEMRLQAVMEAVRATGAKRVIDLGCGEGKLLRELLKSNQFQEIVGIDISHRSLVIASERLHLETMPPQQRQRIRLFQGSLMYRDRRLDGFEAATVIEVIEHLDPPRLAAFERVVFEHAQPKAVVITTPNSEYNVRFEMLAAGNFRHKDHRFEWTRAQFEQWAKGIAERFGYTVNFLPVGSQDPEVEAPTQMAVFTK